MDPFAALGTAAAIAQLVDLSAQLIGKAYETYNTVSGLPVEDEQLGFTTSELHRLTSAIQPAKLASKKSDAELALVPLAKKCNALATQLLNLLKKIKAKDPRSIRSSAAAAIRNVWNDKEKKQLKAQADDCRDLLQTYLIIVMRSDTIGALKILTETGQATEAQLGSLQKHVDKLRKGVTLSHLSDDAKTELANLSQLSDYALDSITSHRILDSISFPEMHLRYNSVGDAFIDTFDWIFEKKACKDNRALRSSTLLREWLADQDGIFHIAGKPGAGKSMLTKFLYKHKQTKQHLQSWAKHRKLVIGKAFFWLPGGEMQNSITAMMRTLLYEVLEQVPELVPSTFPEQWSRVKALPWQAPVRLNFDEREINDAFQRLLEHCNQCQQICFCLFIDGLDECQESLHGGHKVLSSLLSDWTNKYRGDIKICVSSREHPIFLNTFPRDQSIKLQELTYSDIHNFVLNKLEKNESFLALETQEGEAASLISDIATRANGVFLWAALVVRQLEHACEFQDSFADLRCKLDSLHPEIEYLFQQLLDSVDPSDRKQSLQSFAVVLRILEEPNHYHDLTLLGYSLLDECHLNPTFALNYDFEAHPFFSESKNTRVLRLERARRQLYKRCRGLLDNTGESVQLTHRSVHEFLLRSKMKNELSAMMQGFDVIKVILQTMVAELVLRMSDIDDYQYTSTLKSIVLLVGAREQYSEVEALIPAIWNIHKMQKKYHDVLKDGSSRVSVPTYEILDRLPYCAAQWGLCQYFTSHKRPAFVMEGVNYGGLVQAIHKDMSTIGSLGNGHNEILRWAFQQGLSPNQKASSQVNVSLWATYLERCLYVDTLLRHRCFSEAMQIFLEFGANRNVLLSTPKRGRIVVEGSLPIGTTELHIQWNKKFYSTYWHLGNPGLVLSKTPISLSSYISKTSAANKEMLLSLLNPSHVAKQNAINLTPAVTESSQTREKTSQIVSRCEDKIETACSAGKEAVVAHTDMSYVVQQNVADPMPVITVHSQSKKKTSSEPASKCDDKITGSETTTSADKEVTVAQVDPSHVTQQNAADPTTALTKSSKYKKKTSSHTIPQGENKPAGSKTARLAITNVTVAQTGLSHVAQRNVAGLTPVSTQSPFQNRKKTSSQDIFRWGNTQWEIETARSKTARSAGNRGMTAQIVVWIRGGLKNPFLMFALGVLFALFFQTDVSTKFTDKNGYHLVCVFSHGPREFNRQFK